MNQFSLADHSIAFESIDLSFVVGNGSALENIAISWDNDNFSYTTSADGEATLNKNYMLSGQFTLSLQQTNPYVAILTNLFKNQLRNGITNTAKTTIKDINKNINGEFFDVVVTKIPDYTASKEVSNRDFVFKFKKGMIN